MSWNGAVEVILPRIARNAATAKLNRWLAAEGERVREGQPLFEYRIPTRRRRRVEAPASGVLRGLRAEVGDWLPVGATVAWIVGEDESPSIPNPSGARRRVALTERVPESNTGYRILWPNLTKFLQEMNTIESGLLLKLSYKPEYYKISILNHTIDHRKHNVNMDQFRKEWYNKILSPPVEVDTSLFQYLTEKDKPFGLTPENFNDLIQSYLYGIAWVLQYYTEGINHINPSYYYPYFHEPLFKELAEMSSQLEQADFDALDKDIKFYIPHQLLSVLPLKSLNLIPEKLRLFATDNFSSVRDLFPSTFTMNYEGNKHGNAIIRFVDPDRIISAVNEIAFTKKEREFYFSSGETLMIEIVFQCLNLLH